VSNEQTRGRAFCAGGDVKEIVNNAKGGTDHDILAGSRFMQEEYELNHLIGTLRKPYISLLDGISSTPYFNLVVYFN
jgi:3-hydroxyisobutyryl-CoA hydrolase